MSDNIYVLYRHTSPSGKAYIGITNDYTRRCEEHQRADGSSPKFHRAIKKYGWDNFIHEQLAVNITEEEAMELEQLCIEKWNTILNGYNMLPGGNVPVGVILRGVPKTDAHIEQLSASCAARIQTTEQKINAYMSRWKVTYEQAVEYFDRKERDGHACKYHDRPYWGYTSVKKTRHKKRPGMQYSGTPTTDTVPLMG